MKFSIQRVLFLFCLVGILFFHNLMVVRNALWVLLFVLSFYHFEFAAYSAFFFSAFFMPAELFENPIFTPKHFHISMAMLAASLLLRGKLIPMFQDSYQRLKVLLPWIGILAISTGSALFFQTYAVEAVKMNANILALILGAAFLIMAIQEKEMAVQAVQFFIGGTVFRVLLSVLSFLKLEGYYPLENFLYNNHFAFLNCTALFLILPFCLTYKQPMQKFIAVMVQILLFSGLLMSMSRTGYVSFFFGYLFFSFLLLKGFQASDRSVSKKDLVMSLAVPVLTMLLIMGFLLIIFPIFTDRLPELQTGREFFDRLKGTTLVLVPLGWQQAFFDSKFGVNFGLFGHIRRDQFYVFSELIKMNWITGVGLIHKVTDFHMLYLTLLGGSGIIGLSLFLFFCRQWWMGLWRNLLSTSFEISILRAGLLAAFFVWLCYSLMESFLIQFNIWVVIALGIIFAQTFQKRSHG